MSYVPSPGGYHSLPTHIQDLVDAAMAPAVAIENFTWQDINDASGSISHFKFGQEHRTIVLPGNNQEPASVKSGEFEAKMTFADPSTAIIIHGASNPQWDAVTYFSHAAAWNNAWYSASLEQLISLVAEGKEVGHLVRVASVDEVRIDAESGGAVALNLSNAAKLVTISGMDSVIVVGPGEVHIDDDAGVTIAGDWRDQTLVAGDGDDVLISGGGRDKLVGGAGNDKFVFTGGKGSYLTISDFSEGDTLAFDVQGVSSIDELKALIVGVDEPGSGPSDDGVTVWFSDDSAITLVGMSSSDITADMIAFI